MAFSKCNKCKSCTSRNCFNFPARPPGQSRRYLQDNYSLADDSVVCLNGHVLHLYLQTDSCLSATTTAIFERFGCRPHYYQVRNLMRKAKTMLKSYSSSGGILEKLCQTPFNFVAPSKPVLDPESAVQITNGEPSLTETVPEAVDQTPLLGGPKLSVSDPGTSGLSVPPALRLRTKDSTAREQLLRKRMLFQSKSTATMKKYYREQVAKLKVKLKTHPTIIKHLRQKVSRLQVQNKILKHKLRVVSTSGSELEKTRYKKIRQACKQKCKDKIKKIRTDFENVMREQELEFDRRLKSIMVEKDKLIQQLMAE